MTTLRASLAPKWDPLTDPSRPKIGATISRDGIAYTVGKVRAISPATFLIEGKEPDKEGYDELLVERHPTRFFIHWLVWARKVKNVLHKSR